MCINTIKQIGEKMYIKRALEELIIKISKTFPVLLVTGPRQVGKTTLLQYLADENRKYVTLDDPEVRFLAKTDPALFMQRYTPPVLIDDMQRSCFLTSR